MEKINKIIKSEISLGILQLHSLQKDEILLHTKCFHDPILDIEKCIDLLGLLICLQNINVFFKKQYINKKALKLTNPEYSELFFATTKLFHSENKILRCLLLIFLNVFFLAFPKPIRFYQRK